MTAPRMVERVVMGSLLQLPPVAGDYFMSPSGRTAIAVNKVRRMVGDRAGVRYRLFGMRVRLTELPPGITPLPWPKPPPKAAHPPTAEAFIGPPRPPPVIASAALARLDARRRVVGLLRDDRVKDRPVPKVRIDNHTALVADWRDPDDMSAQRRTAKIVHGFRSRDPIQVLVDNSTIGRTHARAARRFRKDYELGVVGLRASRDLADPPSGFASGSGPSEARMKHLEAYRATIAALLPHLLEAIVAIIVREETILVYSTKKGMSRHAVAGYILASLDYLSDHYRRLDDDHRKEAQLAAISEPAAR